MGEAARPLRSVEGVGEEGGQLLPHRKLRKLALGGVIEREKGVVEEVDHWGMRDLAYPVRKQMRGYYVRLVYNGPAALVAELERNIRITDGIFKFVTVKLADEAGEVA